MLKLENKDYKAIAEIHKSLYLGEWKLAARTASEMLESFHVQIYQFLAASVPPEELEERLRRGRKILEARGTKYNPSKMTFGAWNTLFKESDLFGFYGEKKGIDLSAVKNWTGRELLVFATGLLIPAAVKLPRKMLIL